MVSKHEVNDDIDKCNLLLNNWNGKTDSKEMMELTKKICIKYKSNIPLFQYSIDFPWDSVTLKVAYERLIDFKDKENCGEIFSNDGM